jgi:hypothetical protein
MTTSNACLTPQSIPQASGIFSGAKWKPNYTPMPLDKQDLLQKLRQLEEQARLGIHEHPNGLILERLRFIAALTSFLRASVQKDIEAA